MWTSKIWLKIYRITQEQLKIWLKIWDNTGQVKSG